MPNKKPFHNRFNIEVDLDEAKHRFVNRAYQAFFNHLHPPRDRWQHEKLATIAERLGTTAAIVQNVHDLIRLDFLVCLHAIEVLYVDAMEEEEYEEHEFLVALDRIDSRKYIDDKVLELLHESEHDLSLEWRNGEFWRTGAKLLDEKLVNESLRWLHDKGYSNIYEPFENALRAYLESVRDPRKREDVVHKMYKALEATAQVVLSNKKGLSANREGFIKSLGSTEWHTRMLKEYIAYANELARHARVEGEPKIEIGDADAENFIYLTGIFIRFAIQKLEGQTQAVS